MSRKLFDADGNEVEVPSDEELTELNAKAESAGTAEEFKKLEAEVRETLGIDAKDDLGEAVKLAKEAANPNWKAARTTIAKLTKFAEEKGAKVAEDGEVSTETKIDPEQIAKDAASAARNEIYKNDLETRLSKYPEDKREVLKTYFDKLSAGEELNSPNIDKYMKESEGLVFPKGTPTPTVRGGDVPVINESEGGDFANTEEGQNAGKMMDLPVFNQPKTEGK